ncbi:SDR family NAD(P)-dependent oxidoreductase [Marmoricola sp. RAF53]|uniref:SDR family NAD(P)-dependent oxidoreductase n=1 Tax=Marmoricola sp. RAF53 TaxID=3233059 RepID=UPI003F947989
MTEAVPELAGKVAVLAGSTSGIGRAVAEAYAAAGAWVVVNGRRPEAVEETVESIASAGGVVIGIVGSAADPAVVEEMVAATRASYGAVDVLVNCAGVAEPLGSSILDVSLEDWRAQLDAHLTSTFLTCRAFVPGMVERGRGVVVNTSSHAFTGTYGGTGYAAGKGGVNSLTYALAAELAEHGIRVNAVCPGARTRLSEGPDHERTIARLHARGLIDDLVRDASLAPAPPEHVAALYVFLAGERSAGLTGRVLAGAGGYLGAFDPPRERLLAWRDAASNPPWTSADIEQFLAVNTPD